MMMISSMIIKKIPTVILRTNAMHHQKGTALTEFVIVASVLIPIMFGIPMIGKIIDLKQTTVQASRYSAWETTVSPQNAPQNNLDERFFSSSSAPIGSADIGPNTLWGPEAPTLAEGDVGGTEPLSGYQADTAIVVSAGATSASPSAYTSGENNGVQYAPGTDEGVAYKVGQAVEAVGVLDGPTDGDWTMLTDGLVRGEASVQLQSNGWLESQTITHGTVIMTDNWSVRDAVAARDRVRPLVPAAVLDTVGEVIGAIGLVPGVTELKHFGRDSGRGVFGYIDVEPLPPSEDLGPRPLKPYEE